MPIQCPVPIHSLSDHAFTEVDRTVMPFAFQSQKTLGRLCNEEVYANDIAARVKAHGFRDVHTHVPVTLTHGSFSTTFHLDLVVNQMVYILKATESFTPEHIAEAIHFAALLSVDRVKLLTLTSPKVLGRPTHAPFSTPEGRQVTYVENRRVSLSDQCDKLKTHLEALLMDWGGSLSHKVYEDALIHLMAAEHPCSRGVSIIRDGIQLGTQNWPRHSDHAAFVVTAFGKVRDTYEEHLRCLLQFTKLRGIHWINLKNSQVDVVTLEAGKLTPVKPVTRALPAKKPVSE